MTGTPRRGEPSLPQPLSPSLPPTGRERGGQAILLAAALLLLAGCLLQILAGYSYYDLSGHAWGSDDAYISYRYSQNLAAGQGLVFNPGERVEGFSNLLYVLLLAPAAALVSPDHLYAVSAGLNVVFVLAALVLLYRFTLHRLGAGPAAAMAMLVALCPAIWAWVASGLETPLVLLLQVAVWVLVEGAVEEEKGRDAAALCLVAALCVLTRVDGFITPFLAAGFLVLRGRRRAGAAVAAATLATFGATTLWRLSYYGWPLPNTYYAKVTGALPMRLEAGAQGLLSVLLGTGLLVSVAALVIAGGRGLKGFSLRSRDLLPGMPFPAVFAAGWLGYFVYVGGDFYQERFLLALFPMGAWVLLDLAMRSEGRRATVAVVLLALAQLAPIISDPRYSYTRAKYDRWVMLGRFLSKGHRGEVLAIDGAGKVPFFSGLKTIDMLGLTDSHIAHGQEGQKAYFWAGHAKSDLDYVLARRPELISYWLASRWGLQAGPTVEPEKLARAGYRLAYLVNAEPYSKGQGRDILDVRSLPADEIRRLRDTGYRTGVFELKR